MVETITAILIVTAVDRNPALPVCRVLSVITGLISRRLGY